VGGAGADQTWTLMTPNRVRGVSSGFGQCFSSASVRIPTIWWVWCGDGPGQLRVVYPPHTSIGRSPVSIENPEQYVTTAVTLPAFASTQVDNGSVPTAPNVRPDIVAKVAYDTQVSGKALHFELAGLSRQFRVSPHRTRILTPKGLAGSFNTVLEVAKNFA